jgi:predicted GH43/DUF377 family glycosyl hydrolase
MIKINRHPLNPIIRPGFPTWRKVSTFNPGVIKIGSTIYLIERATASLRPMKCSFGLWQSENGIDFKLSQDKPILSPESLNLPNGTIEDPRITKIDNTFYMTYAYRPYTFNCFPTGDRVPEYQPVKDLETDAINNTVSAIAMSKDGIDYQPYSVVNPNQDWDERDLVLFPEKIDGKFALLSRPKNFKDIEKNKIKPSIWISYSDDLKVWSAPELVASPRYPWGLSKIGSGTPPILTNLGWLLIYHAVDEKDVYRVGAMILDKNKPNHVIYRSKEFLMQPEAYYEKVGLIIPNVIFPTGLVLQGDLVYLYYGACDTSIGLATFSLSELLNYFVTEGEKFE